MIAIRAASIAAKKQSDGEAAATTGTGDSPFLPYRAMSRSVCSVLVGMPVEGPARCTSTTSSGSSTETARLTVSAFSSMPGPDVVVTASDPPNDAPSAALAALISSSAWKVRTPNFLCLDSSCRMSEAGVIGYEPRNSGSLASWPAAIRP